MGKEGEGRAKGRGEGGGGARRGGLAYCVFSGAVAGGENGG